MEKEGGGTLLECGYHGWTFDRKGDYVRIPQCPSGQRIPRGAACRRKLATATKLGILFVWFGEYTEADTSLLPLPSFFDRHPNAIIYRDQTRILPYSYESFVESVLDPAQVAFVHHGIEQNDRDKVNPSRSIKPSRRIRKLVHFLIVSLGVLDLQIIIVLLPSSPRAWSRTSMRCQQVPSASQFWRF